MTRAKVIDPTTMVETKLTKSEFVELLLEQTMADIRQKEEVLEKEKKALREGITYADVEKFLPRGEVEMDRYHCGSYRVAVTVDVPKGNSPLRKRLERYAAIDEELSELRSLCYRLRSRKSTAKNEVLKKLLEASPEGCALLEQINAFRLGLQPRLLASVSTAR